MAKKPLKDVVVSFRLSEEENAPFAEIQLKTNTKASAFWRKHALEKTPVFKEASKHQERLLFIANKASNNINQLAHQVNAAHRRGVVSEKTYIQWLNRLTAIEALLMAGTEDAD